MASPSSIPVLPPVPPTIGAIIGPQLVGTLLNFTLYGVLAVQTYIYHLSFEHDNYLVKTLVYFVLAFETAQTIMNGVDAFQWFASGFGDLLVITKPGISAIYTPLMGSIIALVVQFFFCYRIFLIKRSAWWLCCIIAAISVMQAVAGIMGGIMGFHTQSISQANQAKIEVNIWLIGEVVADVSIATIMSIFLLRSSNHFHHHTHQMVRKIVTLVVETNSLSAFIAMLGVILYSALPTSTYFICPTLVISKIYANTLLLTFNNRAYLVKERVVIPQRTTFSSGLTLARSQDPEQGTSLSIISSGNKKISEYSIGTLNQVMVPLENSHTEQ